ncbi:Coatomer subunit gamma-1 [Acorus calamus]|uniref:Coatomer subunit gamma-1 n=1 Tax=Acorus calamus TaxID=4465 RepID=A0AAV9CG37_ACOCL|nr:Coatomer subunit gamma-1 [Acorus calamus]
MQETKEPSEEPFDISFVPREIKTQLLAEKKAMEGNRRMFRATQGRTHAYCRECS